MQDPDRSFVSDVTMMAWHFLDRAFTEYKHTGDSYWQERCQELADFIHVLQPAIPVRQIKCTALERWERQ